LGTLSDIQTAHLLAEVHQIRSVFLTVLSDEDCDYAQKLRPWPRGGVMNLYGPESGQQVASSPWQGDMNSVRAADTFRRRSQSIYAARAELVSEDHGPSGFPESAALRNVCSIAVCNACRPC
jgi:hypothetical protein